MTTEEQIDQLLGTAAEQGMQLTVASELHHDVPLSRGGKHEISNVQFVVTEVNRAKNTMSHIDFVAMCREVATTAKAPQGEVKSHSA